MGVDLCSIRRKGYCHLNWTAWGEVKYLAKCLGWQPEMWIQFAQKGPRNYDAYYVTNDGQRVNAGDARSMAAALSRILDTETGPKVKKDRRFRCRWAQWYFSKEGEDLLKEVIAFLDKGAFRIY